MELLVQRLRYSEGVAFNSPHLRTKSAKRYDMKNWITASGFLFLVGCTSGKSGDGSGSDDPGWSSGTGGDSGSNSDGSDSDSDSGIDVDLDNDADPDEGDDQGGGCTAADLPAADANLVGTVYAPNMELPISGALVYLTKGQVEGVPDSVYCAECVELSCDTHYVFTKPDGTFELPAVSGTDFKLVVQKGQFLRVSTLDVSAGTNMVDASVSNLPGEWNPAGGMWIPKIAVYEAEPDMVFNVLAKFGMGDVTGGQLVSETEPFTLIEPNADQGAFMDDLETMSEFHIVFVPCAATKFWDEAPVVSETRAQNIRDYVAAGGKWYATDHSNEYIAEPFPVYQDFHTQDGEPDLQPAYSVESTVVDADLEAWLSALPPALKDIGGGYPNLGSLPQFTTELNYSGLDAVHEVLVENSAGEMVNVGHHTWVEGPCTSCSDPNEVRPMAVSGQFGCGRMMYSTFETSSDAHEGMSPQELVLLYMILEIGVCHSEPPADPPTIVK